MKEHKLRIKVCGMREPANIADVATLPIDYMGFIFHPQSARYVEIPDTSGVHSPIQKVGVFVNEDLSIVREKIVQVRLDVIQLHGGESPEYCHSFTGGHVQIIKAFGIDQSTDWNDLIPYLSIVDYFLFDTKSKQHGGTGRSFDWAILESYPFDKPYFLSGGLSLENIQEAARSGDQRLIGLDLNSKFEIEPGLKNIQTLTHALKTITHE